MLTKNSILTVNLNHAVNYCILVSILVPYNFTSMVLFLMAEDLSKYQISMYVIRRTKLRTMQYIVN